MPTDVIMPQMGESIFEGTITKWLKKTGDPVEKDEPLFEISTDKVDAEIPSPVAGVLTEIRFPEGETVEINTVVAVIDGPGGSSQADDHAPVAKVTEAAGTEASQIADAGTEAPAPQAAPPAPEAPPQALRSSPLVRRIAKDNHLDLSQITGTGSNGRINKEDVLRFMSEHGPGSAAPQAQVAPAPLQVAVPQATAQVVPLSKMRAIIAQRMVESKQTSPHAHTVYKVDMTRIARQRAREKARFEQQHGVKLTYMPFIAAAAVAGADQVPHRQRLAGGQLHPLPPEHQPGHRRGARVGSDRTRHQAGRGAQFSGPGPRHRRPGRAAPAPRN